MVEYTINNSLVRKQQLKNILEEGESVKSEDRAQLDKISSIKNIILSTDNIIKEGDVKDRVQNTSEVVMDAQIMKVTHEIFGGVMETVISSEFSDEDFLNALTRVVFKDNNENWDELAKSAIETAHTVKFSPYLLDAIDADVIIVGKEAKDKQRRSKGQTGKESRPEDVKELKKRDEGAQRVNVILKQIRNLYSENNNRPIPFYKLVIDPDNFLNTIDNVFQVSFLVRDNRLGTEIDQYGYPALTVKSKNEQKSGNFTDTDTDTVQAICSFNPTFIEKMIKMYKIKEPLLPVNP